MACEDAAWALGAADRVGEARPLFDDALRRYERLGAAWDLARAAAWLRALASGQDAGDQGTGPRAAGTA